MRSAKHLVRILMACLIATLLLSACEKKAADKADAQAAPQQPQKPTANTQADAQSAPTPDKPDATPAATNPPATNPPATNPPDAANPTPAPAGEVSEADANAASEKMLAAMKDANAIMTQHMADADKLVAELKTFVDPREADLNKAIKTIRAYKNTLDEAGWEAFHTKHTSRDEYQTFATLQEDFNGRYPDKIGLLEEQMDRVQGNDDDGSVQDVSGTPDAPTPAPDAPAPAPAPAP